MALYKKWQKEVIKILVKDFGWLSENAATWVETHSDYMTAMCESSAPEWQTAKYINDMIDKAV